MNLKLIISDSLYFFKSHFKQIATMCLPWLFAVAVVGHLTLPVRGEPTPDMVMLFISGWMFKQLIYPIYTGALILLMSKRAQREQPDTKALISMLNCNFLLILHFQSQSFNNV